VIQAFMDRIKDDPRISRAHISIYLSLWKLWTEAGQPAYLSFFRNDLRDMCKVTSQSAFYKAIRELDEYEYIDYTPSVNHNKGSLVHFSDISKSYSIKP